MKKRYKWEYVTAERTPALIAKQMAQLTKEGWKDLQYVAHSSWGDCQAPEIGGNRPMTPQEIEEYEKLTKQEIKERLRDLTRQAKVYGYKLVKITK